jgi:Ca-activated chloride channel family protein
MHDMARWLPLVLAIPLGVLHAQTPVFRDAVELVTMGVTVSDRSGAYLGDLGREHFEILEDGKPQTITYFAPGGQAESAPALHVGLLFDTSGSMSDDIGLARSAAVRFLNTLKDAEDMTLVDFDTEVRMARYGQRDFPRMVERIRNRKPDGFTAMYDALGVYLDRASEDEGRTILVLYTDGGDTRSTIGFGDVMTLVRASNVTIYAVGFLENQSASLRNEQRARLYQLAEATGGQAFFPTRMKEVETAYDTILSQVRAQYSLGYASSNTRQDGSWRKVEIRLKHPASRGMRLQSRKGYFAPYRP